MHACMHAGKYCCSALDLRLCNVDYIIIRHNIIYYKVNYSALQVI